MAGVNKMSNSIDYFDCPRCGGNAHREQDNRTCEVHVGCSDCDWSGENVAPVDKTIKLPVHQCIITLTGPDGKGRYEGGSIATDWKVSTSDEPGDDDYNRVIDGIEAVVLAHAMAGIDVESPAYLEGVETALDSAANNS